MPKPYIPNDRLAKTARDEGYRARSVYKLKELNRKFRLLKLNQQVLDVGAFPGSWLQYVSSEIGSKGQVIGIDLKQIGFIAPNVKTFVGNINDIDVIKEKIAKFNLHDFDLIIADMAPNTTGMKYHDQSASLELNISLFKLAKNFLKPGGTVVSKIFQSEQVYSFLTQLKNDYKKVEITTVSASRDRSTEMYIVAQKFIKKV